MASSDSRSEALRRSAEVSKAVEAAPSTFRVLTGDRPTGALHVGHLFGSLENRVHLQDRGVDVVVLIADLQVLSDRTAVGDLRTLVSELLLDYLAVGIDPDRSTIFTHSCVPELNELMLPFLALVTESELRRNPTIKQELSYSARSPSGLMYSYPVHQAADILFCKASVVPVGLDQLPHIEITRTIARRFNETFASVFPLPDALLSSTPLILGVDGRKMSKSLGNSIEIGSTPDVTARQIRKAVTDSERRITFEPESRPGVANLLTMLSAATTGRDERDIADEIGDRGSGELKRLLTEALNERLDPIRKRRQELARDRAQLFEILNIGNARARDIAADTLREVRDAIGMRY